MREGWIQPTNSCWGDRESKQPRQLENIYGIEKLGGGKYNCPFFCHIWYKVSTKK
jgi:hypothetical protein